MCVNEKHIDPEKRMKEFNQFKIVGSIFMFISFFIIGFFLGKLVRGQSIDFEFYNYVLFISFVLLSSFMRFFPEKAFEILSNEKGKKI